MLNNSKHFPTIAVVNEEFSPSSCIPEPHLSGTARKRPSKLFQRRTVWFRDPLPKKKFDMFFNEAQLTGKVARKSLI